MGFDASTKITLNGVQCWETKAPEEVFGRDKNSTYAKRFLKIEWGNGPALVRALRSGSQQIGSLLIITAAQAYPRYPSMYVDTIAGVGEGELGNDDANQIATAEWENFEVTYTPLDLTVGQTELDFCKEVVAFPKEVLQLADGTPLSQGMSITIPTVTLRQSRYNLPNLPISTIINATTNPVNSQPIFGGAAGTVLFDGGRALMKYALDLGYQYDVSYSFNYKPIGWGKALDTSGNWQKVQTTAGQDILGTSDLNALLS